MGREREVAEVRRELAMTRLLTLTGAGGSGKTRLALEVARGLVGAYPDGVWLVELAPLSEGDLVPQAAATALELREQPGRALTDTLVSHLRYRRLLLVLDNCEHLVDAAARLANDLLSSCPQLRILATSREVLRVGGEIVWRVPSLSVPRPEGPPTAERMGRYEAVRLFAQRARSRDPGFELTEQNARAMAEVCRRLDGIPLAIELAATKVGVLSVEQILERLDDSLRLLRGGGRTAPTRHQTLRTTLGWSHGLLGEPERALFRRLSVFAGGWTLEAAEVVGAGDGVEEGDVLDLLSGLVDKSLVAAEAGGGRALRYRMLEPVRQYGRERLEESSEVGAVLRDHADFYLALAREVRPKASDADRGVWLERLEVEHDNIRAALRWAVGTGEVETALRLAGAAVFWFWRLRGYLSEGRGWFESALAQVPGPTSARAEALYYAGYLVWIKGDYPAARFRLEESVAIWRGLGGGGQGGLANALWLLGLVVRSAARADEGLRKKEDLELISAEVDEVEGQSVEQAVRDLNRRPDVEYAQPNLIYRPSGYADEPQFGQLWGLHNTGQTINGSPGTANVDVNGLEASNVTQGDPNLVVAVIDDGVDFAHPDLANRKWVNPGESGSGKETNGIDDDGNGYVDDVNGWDFHNDDKTSTTRMTPTAPTSRAPSPLR